MRIHQCFRFETKARGNFCQNLRDEQLFGLFIFQEFRTEPIISSTRLDRSKIAMS